jgi:hypothetical protein
MLPDIADAKVWNWAALVDQGAPRHFCLVVHLLEWLCGGSSGILITCMPDAKRASSIGNRPAQVLTTAAQRTPKLIMIPRVLSKQTGRWLFSRSAWMLGDDGIEEQ